MSAVLQSVQATSINQQSVMLITLMTAMHGVHETARCIEASRSRLIVTNCNSNTAECEGLVSIPAAVVASTD